MLTPRLLPRRSPPRLVQPMLKDVLRMARRPPVRQQRLQVRLPRAEPQQHVPQIGLWLQVMPLRSRQDREQHRRSRACARLKS